MGALAAAVDSGAGGAEPGDPGVSGGGGALGRRPGWFPQAVVAVLLVALGLLLADAWGDSLTEDEVTHIQSGTCAVLTGRLSVDETNPPLFKLLAAPAGLALGQARPSCAPGSTDLFPLHDPDRLRRLAFFARLPAVAMTLLTGMAVLLWAGAMLGRWAGLAAMLLTLMEPTVLGHGHLVTGDLPVTLATVLCLGGHWAWTRGRRRRWLVVAGLGLGIGLLSKSSAIQLFGILVLIEGIELLRLRRGGRRGAVPATPRPGLALGVIGGLGYLVVILVNLPFGHAETALDWRGPLAVLAPPSWWYGLLWQAGHVQAGHVAYINGAVHQHGVWYYFPEALALKASLPLACLGLAGAAAALLARRREVAQWVLLPAALLVVLAGASGIDIGVRYVLPVFPLLAVAGAFCLLPWTGPAPFRRGPGPDRRWRAVARAALVAALLAAPVTALASAGGHIGYFQLVDRPERYLSDSNLDWGQDAWRLRDWWVAAGRPPLTNTYFSQLPLSAYGIDSTLVSPTSEPAGPGLYAISLTHATAFGRGADCPYVHALLAPITARVGTSIVVTHIPGLLPRQRPGPDADCL